MGSGSRRQVQLREEREAQEAYLAKCERDVLFWMGNECKIQTKGMQECFLQANYTQRRVFEAIDRQVVAGVPVRVIVLKGRQQGVSTFCQAYLLHRLIHEPKTRASTIAHDFETVADIEDRIFRTMVEGLESPYVMERRKGGLWKNGAISSVLTAGSKKVGRGKTLQFLHATELAYWHRGDLGDEQADAVWTSLMNSIPMLAGTFILAESTADGAIGAFHDVYQATKAGKMPGWVHVVVPYYKHEEYRWPLTEEQDRLNHQLQKAWKAGDGKWVRKLVDELGLDEDEEKWRLGGGQDGECVPLTSLMWRRNVGLPNCKNDRDRCKQEYPASDEEAFLSSGRPTFSPRVIGGWRALLPTYKVVRSEVMEGYWIWKGPEAGHVYRMGVDVCEGSEVPDNESDWTVGLVFDETTSEYVAMYRTQRTPRMAADDCVQIALEYGAEMVPEVNGTAGGSFIGRLMDYEDKVEIYARKLATSAGEVPELGWKTDGKNRSQLIDYLRDRVRDDRIVVPFPVVLEEMAANITTRQRANHRKGMHDDTVISAALCLVRLREREFVGGGEKPVVKGWDPAKMSGRAVVIDVGWEWEKQQEMKVRVDDGIDWN